MYHILKQSYYLRCPVLELLCTVKAYVAVRQKLPAIAILVSTASTSIVV